MPRVSFSPRRDLDKPLVEIPDDAPRAVRFGLAAFRWYLVAIFVLALLTGLVWIIALVTGNG